MSREQQMGMRKQVLDDMEKLLEDRLRSSLLWKYDLSRFNWEKMRTLAVRRVIECGRMDDFYAILSAKDMSFVCAIFNLKIIKNK